MARRGTIGKKATKDRDKRPVRWRKYPHLFLIVCEDEKTEPYYFEQFISCFPEETVFLRAVGSGSSSLGVVERSEIEKEKLAQESNKLVDEVWVVFDKDDAEKSVGNTERFRKAFKKAQELKHRVAYSNEVFELWLLLHFIGVDSNYVLTREEIYSKLDVAGKSFVPEFEYVHGNTDIVDIVSRYGSENDAIERAVAILKLKEGIQPIEANPSTTVHILIRRLRELIEYYSFKPD
ncbi:MAG: RloB family protein [Carboxylicivirga sp.]|jgi:hypothetical protein|nr:RloB family protein [Carboxylicivirga sp.]